MSQIYALIRLRNMNSETVSAVEAERRRLQVFVRNIVGDNALAEDIVQDTVLACLQEVSQGRNVSCPGAWLMKVARNKALDAVRSAGYSRRTGIEAAWRQDSGENIELHFGMKERIGQVRKVVGELPELQRSAFILRDVLGCDADETASVLGCSGDNARQLLSRARKRIREYLLNNE